MPSPVLSKHDFVNRYGQGEFGNRCPMWDTLSQVVDSKYPGLIHIRNRVRGGKTWYNVPAADLIDKFHRITTYEGYPADQLYFGAMCPTELTVIQGEVMRSYRGLNFLYTTQKVPMRDALMKQSVQTYGASALLILKDYLPPNDYEWLMYLLDAYDGHVVEFTTLDREWGTVPGFKTLFWEVRKY